MEFYAFGPLVILFGLWLITLFLEDGDDGDR